jgi:hypothetical protein
MIKFDIKLGRNLKNRLDYTTLSLIGKGGYKIVFDVDDKALGIKVALYTIM